MCICCSVYSVVVGRTVYSDGIVCFVLDTLRNLFSILYHVECASSHDEMLDCRDAVVYCAKAYEAHQDDGIDKEYPCHGRHIFGVTHSVQLMANPLGVPSGTDHHMVDGVPHNIQGVFCIEVPAVFHRARRILVVEQAPGPTGHGLHVVIALMHFFLPQSKDGVDANHRETSVVGEGVFAVPRMEAVPFLDEVGREFHLVFDKVRADQDFVQPLARGVVVVGGLDAVC